MSDFPSTYSPSSPAIHDFSGGQTTAKVVDEEPPSYGSLSPSVLNNTNNVGPKSAQYQPQWGAPRTVRSTANMYGVPIMINPELHVIENYKVWSIMNIIFCCWCIGCAACYYSFETDDFKLRGDIQGALNSARNARTLNIISTILGIIININFILYYTGTY